MGKLADFYAKVFRHLTHTFDTPIKRGTHPEDEDHYKATIEIL